MSLKFAISGLMLWATAEITSAECQLGQVKGLTLEPIAGYQNAELAGTARFGLSYGNGSMLYGYVSPAQQNMDQLYATLLTSVASGINVEICVDPNPAAVKAGYFRVTSITFAN